jgi:hypothetical protein
MSTRVLLQFSVLLTVHHSIHVSVWGNQRDARFIHFIKNPLAPEFSFKF